MNKNASTHNHLVLVTGGSRSGKSSYAQLRAETFPAPRSYIATCPRIDREMEARISAHQTERAGRNWQTIECSTDLPAAFAACPPTSVVLVDCLTLWANNLLYHAEKNGSIFSENSVLSPCQTALLAAKNHAGPVFFVTNEIGMGIIPDNRRSRLFRDAAGRINQIFSSACDEVVFLVSGIPLTIKPPAFPPSQPTPAEKKL